MSLRAFKESLKPCQNSSTQIQSQSQSQSQSSSSIFSQISEPAIPRKPPKSSLAQQLLRLQAPPLSLQPPQTQIKQTQQDHNCGEAETDEEEDEEDPEPLGSGNRPKVSTFQFDHTGPYEPLVLSSQGEFPVIQVLLKLVFLLSHSC